MKGINYLIGTGLLVLISTTSMADSITKMNANWICTTNASSSSIESEKAADDKMAKNAVSAVEAFNYAAANCRDCTKITCEAQND